MGLPQTRSPGDDAALSSALLGDVLTASPDWPHGSFRVVSSTRIGDEHGFSGRIERVVAVTKSRRQSFVVKQASAAAVDRELLFRSECAGFLGSCVPSCYGGATDAGSGRGIARFLSEGVDARLRPALVSANARELGKPDDLADAVVLAVLPLLQSAVGWAGREDLPSAGRQAAVCESWLRSVCLWYA